MTNDESTQGNDGPTTRSKRRWPKVVAGITAGCVMAGLLMLGLADGGHGGTSARTEAEPRHCKAWAGDYLALGGGYDLLTLKADCSMEGTKIYGYGYVFDYVPGSFTDQGNGIRAFDAKARCVTDAELFQPGLNGSCNDCPDFRGRFELQPTVDSPTGVVLYFASRDGLKSDDSDMHNYLAPEGYKGYRGGDAKDDVPDPTGARSVALS